MNIGKKIAHDLSTCTTHASYIAAPKSTMPTSKDMNNEGFQIVKRKTKLFPIPKKNNHVTTIKVKDSLIKLQKSTCLLYGTNRRRRRH